MKAFASRPVRGLLPPTSGNRSKQVVVVLFCYLDDSGEDNEPLITLAGYLSLEECWRHFEVEARAYFDSKSISHLHTVDFHHSRGEFDGWDWGRKRKFATELYEILARFMGVGLEASVLKSVYQTRRKELGLNKSVSAIGGCFQVLLTRITSDDGIKDVLSDPDVDLSFVVESGNKNNGNILDIFNHAKAHRKNLANPILKNLVFADKKDFIALQVADFLAYYRRRLRVRGSSASRAADEINFFIDITKNIRPNYFLATDFGG